MTPQNPDAAALLGPGVYGKLRRLRGVLRARLAGEGLAWVLMAVVAAVFVSLAFDYLLRLNDALQRGIVLGGLLAGVLWTVWRELFRPMLVRMSEADLALLVERHYGQLEDRLVGAIEFARAGGEVPEGTSRAMVARMAQEAEAIAAPLDFTRLVERRRLGRVLLIAACTLALLAGFALWQRDLMDLWFRRNVLLADADWPQQTYLEVAGRDFHVLRGDSLMIVVYTRAGSVAPPHVTLHRVYASVGRPTEDRVEAVAEGAGKYVKVVEAVNEPFEFYVTGGDDETDRQRPHEVHVIDPPALQDVRFTVEYPAYTQLEPRRVDATREVLTVPFKGRLRLDALANKDLAAAEIRLNGGRIWARGPFDPGGTPVPPLATRHLTAVFEFPADNEPASKRLAFHLRDMQGHPNRGGQVFSVQVLPDEPPAVQIRKVGGIHDLRIVTPNATIPLAVSVKDDYGIGLRTPGDRDAGMIAEAASRLGRPAEEVRTTLRAPAVELRATAGKNLLLAEPVGPLVENRVHLRVSEEHRLALGGRASAGQTVRVVGQAADSRTPDCGGPGVGTSGPLEFSVVEQKDLVDELLRRQKRLSDRFAEAVHLQGASYAKTETAAASDDLRRGSFPDLVGEGLVSSARGQRAVGDVCAGTATALRAILEEMACNGIGEGNERNAMTLGIINPLTGLAERCGRVVVALGRMADQGRHAGADEVRALADDIAEQAAEQRAIMNAMEAIGRRMEKLRSLQVMADRVERMIRWLQELRREMDEHGRSLIEGSFEAPTTQPAPPP